MTNQLLPIIFNPKAGTKYSADYRKKIEKQISLLTKDGVSCLWLNLKKELSEHLRTLPWERIERLLVIGGDGTVSKTAQFLLDHNLDKTIGIIPQGSANVLASALNIPSKERLAIKLAITGTPKKIDAGLINGKYWFLICFSAGYLPAIVNQTAQTDKNLLGFFAYFKKLLSSPLLQTTDFQLEFDGQKQIVNGNTLVIANAISLFKLQPRKKIDFTDGLLDIFVAQNKHRWGFFIIGLMALLKKHLPFTFSAQEKRIFIPFLNPNVSLLLDGEPFSLKGGINIEIVPKKLKVVISSPSSSRK
jgi:diacylglycerol kinase family enzyme